MSGNGFPCPDVDGFGQGQSRRLDFQVWLSAGDVRHRVPPMCTVRTLSSVDPPWQRCNRHPTIGAGIRCHRSLWMDA